MPLDISAEQMIRYRATAHRRREERAQQLRLRRERAWAMAQAAKKLLKEEFKAQKVIAFGSILTPDRFHERSDVDLAVWGLDERSYYRAVSRLLDLDPTIDVDLVEAELASVRLLRVIEQEGVEL